MPDETKNCTTCELADWNELRETPWGAERTGDCKWPAPASVVKSRITDNPPGAKYYAALGYTGEIQRNTGDGCCCWQAKKT